MALYPSIVLEIYWFLTEVLWWFWMKIWNKLSVVPTLAIAIVLSLLCSIILKIIGYTFGENNAGIIECLQEQ